jgi:competence protein ComEC
MSEFEFHVLNVGQGSTNAVITPENHCLLADIEGTNLGKHEKQPVHEYISDYLTNINDERDFDEVHLVASHHDKDHLGNHELIPELDLDRVWWPKSIDVTNPVGRNTVATTIENITQTDALNISTDHSDSIDLSQDVSINVVSPPATPLNNISKSNPANISRNDNSLCLLIEHQNLSILYPGDAENHGIDWIVEKDATSNVDCLVAPHHGSATGEHTTLLNHCQPDQVIISSAHNYQNAQYEHPHDEFLTALDQRDIETYWTAVHGNIKVRCNGNSAAITSQAQYSTAPLDLHSSAADEGDLCEFAPEI